MYSFAWLPLQLYVLFFSSSDTGKQSHHRTFDLPVAYHYSVHSNLEAPPHRWSQFANSSVNCVTKRVVNSDKLQKDKNLMQPFPAMISTISGAPELYHRLDEYSGGGLVAIVLR